MVIGHVHIVGVVFLPAEDYPPLLVDSQAPEALEVSRKFLKLVAGRDFQDIQRGRGVDLVQQPSGFVMQFLWKPAGVLTIDAVINIPCGFASKPNYHASQYIAYRYKCKYFQKSLLAGKRLTDGVKFDTILP